MSYLNGPRINFWGGGSTNVDTANNSEYDPPLFDLANARVISGDSDQQIIDYLRAPTPDYFANGGWNYYGDHQFRLMNNTVSSCGQPGAVTTTGELIGMGVFLLGSIDPRSGDGPYGGPVMVDLDATSGSTTQIYAGGLQIGDSAAPALLVRGNAVSHSRFLGARYDQSTSKPPYATPSSAFFSGTFQLAFGKADIVSYDPQVAILRDIIEASGAQGIVVRFEMFQFFPGLDRNIMAENYAQNRNDANPSLGRIIGSIGPWFDGEPATTPPGRLLQNASLGGAQGLAHLDTGNHRLSLDLVSTLECSAFRPDGQNNTGPIEPNVDYGDLLIGFPGQEGLCQTPSRPDDYYLYGGVYDIDLTQEQTDALAKNPLVIGSTLNELQVNESVLRIYSDDRNTYLNQTSPPISRLHFEIRELGGPLRSPVTVDIQSGQPGTLPDAQCVTFPTQVTLAVGATGYTLDLGEVPGHSGLMQLSHLVDGNTLYFNALRKYAEGALDGLLAADTVAWGDVYEHCLRFFYVLFPAMSKRIPLNDEATIRAVGGELLKRIADDYRNTTLYMPLTRSLSPQQIALLRKFLEQTS